MQNTLAAIERAVARDAGVELDTRLTRDGTVVMHHDAHITRADVDSGCRVPEGTAICECYAEELAHLPSLERVLDLLDRLAGDFGRSVVLNLELKDLPGEPGWDEAHRLASEVATVLQRRGSGPRARRLEVVLSSFDPGALGPRFKEFDTALLLEHGDDNLAGVDRAVRAGGSGVHLPESQAGAAEIARARSMDLSVMVWTVNEPGRTVEFVQQGAKGVITDTPGDVVAALDGFAALLWTQP